MNDGDGMTRPGEEAARPAAPASPAPEESAAAATLRVTPTAQGLRIRGELDFAAVAALRDALESLPPTGPCFLDLGDTTFVDVAGARELAHFVDARPGRTVVLCRPPRLLLRIAYVAWPDLADRIARACSPSPAGDEASADPA